MTHTVLFIEDANSARELIKKHLEEEGFTVLSASTGDELTKMVIQHSPNLIVTNISTCTINELELSQFTSDVKQVLMSETKIIRRTFDCKEIFSIYRRL